MIIPGKDDNYPGGTWSSQGSMQYLPHGILGITLAAIVILFAFHLLRGGKRR
jgi:hypothetical protein